MGSSAYPMLFSPIKVGTTEVKNRVFMPPVSTNLADHGYVTDDLVDHYRARAKGGVGLIITEVVTVEPTYTYLPGDMCCYDDTFIPGWEKLAAAVHEYGCKIMPQLFHPAYMAFNIPGTPRLIAPSFVGPSYALEAPRSITVDEIHELTHQFGDAAVRMQKAGVDGVEVHAAHAHGMLGGFLTPLYNKRTDEYGGSLDARMRFLLEVIAEIRERCGKDFIIDVRISGDEYTDGGLTLNDMIYVSRRLEKAGVDMIHVSGGTTIKARFRNSRRRHAAGLACRLLARDQKPRQHSRRHRRTYQRGPDRRGADRGRRCRHMHDGPRQSVRCRVLQQGRCRQRRRDPSLHWLPALPERHYVRQAHLLHR